MVHRELHGQLKIGYLDVDDLVMEVAAHVAQHLHRFHEGGAASLSTWIEKVAKNRLRDIIERESALKRGRNFRTVPLDSDAFGEVTPEDRIADPAPAASMFSETGDLNAAITRFAWTLTSRQRQTILAVYREDSLRDAARTLGLAPASLYGQLKTIAQLAEDFGLRHWLQPDG